MRQEGFVMLQNLITFLGRMLGGKDVHEDVLKTREIKVLDGEVHKIFAEA